MPLLPVYARAQDDIRFYAKPMVADISQHSINIHAQFSGANLLLYGARNEPGDIIAVVTGPYVNVSLSRKNKVAGMWMQVERTQYQNVPLYYRIASTRPLNTILPAATRAQLGIAYPMPQSANESNSASPTMHRALIQKLRERGWINETPIPVQYFGETLFRSRLQFPGNMPRGTYTVDVFLVHDGRLVAMQSTAFKAVKTGLDYWLYDTSRHRPWLYGACAALLSLVGGWLGNRLIRRSR